MDHLGWENWGLEIPETRAGPKKERSLSRNDLKMKNTRGKILEVGEDPGDQGDVWKRVQGVPGDLGC